MSLNIVYDALLSRLPNSRRTPSGFHNINAPCCVHRGHRPDRRKRGGIKFNGFAAIYNCFNCGYKTGWAPGAILPNKTVDLLNWTGISSETIKLIQFHASEYRYQMAHGGARVIIPDGLKTLDEWANEGCTDPRFLKIATLLQEDEPPRDLKDYYWTPEDNGCDMPSYSITITGTLEYPLSWWGYPWLNRNLPEFTHRGPDNGPQDEDLTPEQWKAIEDEFIAEFG